MKKLEQQLAAIEELRGQPVTEENTAALRKALGNRNNYLAGKAAKIAAGLGITELIPDLTVAFDRFLQDPVKTDPQCWGKNAIIQALADLSFDDAAVYIRGLRHIQMEPVWGGQTDTAGALRGKCALALTTCRSIPDLKLLSYLLEALVDSDRTVRIDAARAISQIDRGEAALILRLRALTGDDDPEVTGACLTGVLAIEGEAGIEFVTRFLDAGDDSAGEAALSLGMTHSTRAFAILRGRWEESATGPLGEVLLTAIALTRLPEAFEFLTLISETVPQQQAEAARRALDSVRVASRS